MKITFTSKQLPELKKYIDQKNENILASDLLLSYLLEFKNLITSEKMKKMVARGLDEEKAFAKILTSELSPKNPRIASLLKEHLNHFCTLISKDKYVNNKYYKNIVFPEVKQGKWTMTHGKYLPFEGFALRDISQKGKYFKEITNLGFFSEEFSFPLIMEKESTWMSVTPHEIETMQKAIEIVSGQVVVLGLGLGYFPYMISLKEDISKVIIIEKDQEAIDLFKKHILPQFANQEKITLIHQDAYSYLEQSLAKSEADYLFADLWQNVDDGLIHYIDLKKKEKLYPKTQFLYWIEDSLIAMIRRIIITIFEESIAGYTLENYQEAVTPYDHIFSDLYGKILSYKSKCKDDFLSLLTNKTINELLTK